jgi:hypothetical protein
VVETAKFMEEARRREEEDDREIRRMNKRLKDMIRQGKEALGSTVTVEVESDAGTDDDEVW